MSDDTKELLEKMQPVLTPGQDVPTDAIYSPPLHDALDNSGVYLPDDPTSELDRLINTERKYLIPIAWEMSRVFRTPPISDDFYRSVPETHKNARLFIVVSRTGIRAIKPGLIEWNAIRVLVKKYDVVRVTCRMDFSNDKFEIRKLWLWTNVKNDFVPVEDPQGLSIDVPTTIEVLARYAISEGIIR